MHKLMWRSVIYRKIWYWYVFKFLCPKPSKSDASEW